MIGHLLNALFQNFFTKGNTGTVVIRARVMDAPLGKAKGPMAK
jgi:hypothetical protein